MSDERHETVADNVSAKHQFREVAKMIPHEEVAVSKMETTTQTCEKSSAVGNAEAMREALEQIRELLSIGGKPDTSMCIRYEAAYQIAEEALAKPPRNCDVGNAAVMRKALENIANMGGQIDYQLGSSEETVYAFRHERSLAHSISECARTTLAVPPRNCDVGTPEEQSARFDAHCRKHMGCLTCPLREKDGGVHKHCEFAWAQMPYDGVK